MTEVPKLKHVGIAVKNMKDALNVYRDMGFDISPEELLEKQSLRIVTIATGEVMLELMEPLDSIGPVAKFIAKKGEGIHHLAFSVKNLDLAVEKLIQLGYSIIDYPSTGLKGSKIAFMHPKSTAGILIELIDKQENVS